MGAWLWGCPAEMVSVRVCPALQCELYACNTSSAGVVGCQPHHSGPLCSVCDEGFSRGGDGACTKCPHPRVSKGDRPHLPPLPSALSCRAANITLCTAPTPAPVSALRPNRAPIRCWFIARPRACACARVLGSTCVRLCCVPDSPLTFVELLWLVVSPGLLAMMILLMTSFITFTVHRAGGKRSRSVSIVRVFINYLQARAKTCPPSPPPA